MNTRFDGRLWIGALGVTFKVKEMETRHLLNTVKRLSATKKGGHHAPSQYRP